MSIKFAKGLTILSKVELFLEWNGDFWSPLAYMRDEEGTIECQYGPVYLSIDFLPKLKPPTLERTANGNEAADAGYSIHRGVPQD